MIAKTAADAIARENAVFWVCFAVVLITAMICATVAYLKTGRWPWEKGS